MAGRNLERELNTMLTPIHIENSGRLWVEMNPFACISAQKNDQIHSATGDLVLFMKPKYRPDYPRRPTAKMDEAWKWVASFVDSCNHRHRHSSIKFVPPLRRHSRKGVKIYRHRAVVYDQAPANPRCWSQMICDWSQPPVVKPNTQSKS